MIGIAYDPESDTAYFRMGKGRIVEAQEAGSLIYDVDAALCSTA
ncbi:DUF2283 domain-containing protein [Aureimonas leprariae]|uniref:DUF2283 domain-containing protein n=1 Tax=Plantimonas leprariae TaxID=2615207 RepID=A0A7V7PRE6_9HYPH|nr:DUF2283 domain-containing protein [Aureimonas leprariae]KAB0681255.1 DUF2283 domain-containing protein [Aureimonas leprariae]